MKNNIFKILIITISFLLLPTPIYSHSGNTDEYGGHYDYGNVSGLGEYHYHHGEEAHLHDDNGICIFNIDKIIIHNEPSTMQLGETRFLSWDITYYNTDTVSWRSSDTSIVEILSNGELYARGFGTADITASMDNGSYTFSVTVLSPLPPKEKSTIEEFIQSDFFGTLSFFFILALIITIPLLIEKIKNKKSKK